MSFPKDENVELLRQGLSLQGKWKSKNEEMAVRSITEFIIDIIRPFVGQVVHAAFTAASSFMDWLRGLFRR